MQNSVPKGEGGMVAVLGSEIEKLKTLLKKINLSMNVILQMTTQKVKLF